MAHAQSNTTVTLTLDAHEAHLVLVGLATMGKSDASNPFTGRPLSDNGQRKAKELTRVMQHHVPEGLDLSDFYRP